MKPLSPLPLLFLVALAGCGPRESAQQRATEDYCHQAANRAWDQQHREQLSQEDTTDDPRSATGLPGVPNAGLSDRYALENDIEDCTSRRKAATEDGTTFGPSSPSPSK